MSDHDYDDWETDLVFCPVKDPFTVDGIVYRPPQSSWDTGVGAIRPMFSIEDDSGGGAWVRHGLPELSDEEFAIYLATGHIPEPESVGTTRRS